MNSKKPLSMTPLEMQQTTEEIMRELGININMALKEYFPSSGFTLLVFPFNNPGKCNYISNAERSSMIEALEAAAKKLKTSEIKSAEIKKRSVHKSWEEYRIQVLQKTAPPTQVSECQMAFYGGATAVLSEILRFGEENIPEDEAIQMVQDLLGEINEFKSLVLSKSKGPKS